MFSSPARSTRSSLPPSSLPHPSDTPTRRSQGSKSRTNTKRSTNDALTLGDNEADHESQPDATARRRRKARGQMEGDVPIVRDVVGERLREDFEHFLET
jgi:DNA replication licensing factor MCM6